MKETKKVLGIILGVIIGLILLFNSSSIVKGIGWNILLPIIVLVLLCSAAIGIRLYNQFWAK